MECLVCGKKFKNQKTLRRHLKRHADKPHVCPTCQKKFFRKDELQSHMKTHSSDDKFVCHKCGLKVNAKSTLRNHVKIIHTQEQYQCSICSKIFSSSFAKQRHERGHGPKQECGRCHKKVKRINEQRVICLGERKRTHKCDVCGNSFLEKKYLTEHKKYKHGAERYQCPKCLHVFAHRSSFGDHKRKCDK